MAYTSKGYQQTWGYDAREDDFKARVGKILAGGLDLKASMRDKALAGLDASRAAEAADATHQRTNFVSSHAEESAQMNTRAPDSRRPGSQREGYVWVDPKGTFLGRVGSLQEGDTGGPSGLGSSGTALRASLSDPSRRLVYPLTARQAVVYNMDTTQRSMHLWRRLNPGIVESNAKLPVSTFKDHYQSPVGKTDFDECVKTNHYRKTDFSEYTEVKLRVMNNLIK